MNSALILVVIGLGLIGFGVAVAMWLDTSPPESMWDLVCGKILPRALGFLGVGLLGYGIWIIYGGS